MLSTLHSCVSESYIEIDIKLCKSEKEIYFCFVIKEYHIATFLYLKRNTTAVVWMKMSKTYCGRLHFLSLDSLYANRRSAQVSTNVMLTPLASDGNREPKFQI